MQHGSSFILPKASNKPDALQKWVRIEFMKIEYQIIIMCDIVRVNNINPFLVFSRDQRGFNVANTSIDAKINESDASRGECHIVHFYKCVKIASSEKLNLS